MANPTAELDRLHASGVMSDEIYAQAKASMATATSSSTPAVDAAHLQLMQEGVTATATVLTVPEPDEQQGRPAMTIEVHPADGSSYEAECAPPPQPAPALKAGDFLQVKVDPEDPKRVAVDWTAFGA